MEATFTLDDFLVAMDQVRRMGAAASLARLVPGMPQASAEPDQDVERVRAMIQSMTRDERQEPGTIDASRRNRIARGCGAKPDDVGKLIIQFQGMLRMLERMSGTKERLLEVRNTLQEMNRSGD